MEPKLSRERWAFIAMLFLINIVTISARAVYLVSVPVWVYVLNCGLFGIAIVFAVLEWKKLKTPSKTSAERI